MNDQAQLFGLVLIAIAVGALFVRLASRNRPTRRPWAQLSAAIIIVMLIALVVLLMSSALAPLP